MSAAGDDVAFTDSATREGGIVEVAALAVPLGRAEALVVSHLVFANRLDSPARAALAFVVVVNFAEAASNALRTVAAVAAWVLSVHFAAAAVHAGIVVADVTGELAILAVEVILADALVAAGVRRHLSVMVVVLRWFANSSVQTRRRLAEVDLSVAVASHESRATVAVVVVDQLHAVQSAVVVARSSETFIDVSLASRSNEPSRAPALEPVHLVGAVSSVVARIRLAVVQVDVANDS